MTMETPPETTAGYRFLTNHIAAGEDVARRQEVWTVHAENLLQEWAKEWHIRARKHEKYRIWWKYCQHILEIPGAILPLVVSASWGKLPRREGEPLATATLALAGCLNALSTFLRAAEKTEQHLHASHRYADLISDAEETLCKTREFRPEVDMTIQKFKMRNDSLLRNSPHVNIHTREAEEL